MKPEEYGYTPIEGAVPAGVQGYRYKSGDLIVAEVSDESMRAYGSGVEAGEWNALYHAFEPVLKEQQVSYLLLLWNRREEEQLLFISNSRRVRAIEFLDYLIGEFGLIKGSAMCAGGRIASVILQVQMSELDLTDTMEYFLKKAAAYETECGEIHAADYAVAHEAELRELQRYTKRQIPWAYVRSTDVTGAGRQLCIKSLENEAGLTVTASEDTYIMIGCRGEVYDISREKFERTYRATQERLDVFEQMLDFLPAVETVPAGDYISLDEIAHLCYPQPGIGIYAKELEVRTRIYPKNQSQEYFLGRPGDYMAVVPDDISDIYVIQRDIFYQTYEAVEKEL